MNARAARLKPFLSFVAALQAKASEITELDSIVIDQPDMDVPWVAQRLGQLVKTLAVADNKATVVAGTKALHHLLPDLVVPMDRRFTQTFFGWDNGRFQHLPEECLAEALRCFAQVAQAVHPAQYVGGGWYTSRTKIIDNAVVGCGCWIEHTFNVSESDPEPRSAGVE
jgi:hypothetical protein